MAKIIDPRTMPEFKEEPGNVTPGPAPAPARAARGEGYAPSSYVVSKLRAFPLDDIRRTIGLDIEAMIAHPAEYGVLEALASGAQTPVPLTIHQNGMDFLGTVRLYKTQNAPGWDSEIHSTRKVPALDENGNPRMNAKGEPVLQYDRNPLRKGDVLKFNGKPLSEEQMDRLRLTGNLGAPLSVTTRDGREFRFVVSVDPYNNHELCRTGVGVIKASLLRPITTKSALGQDVCLTPLGCARDEAGNVVTRVSVTVPKTGEAVALPGGAGELLITVGGSAEVKICGPDGKEDSVKLTEPQVGRLSPSVTTGRGDERVITYLEARQVEELAIGNGVWVGGNRDMSFVVTGTRASATIAPVTDKKHSSYVQYDAGRGKILQTVDFAYAKNREIKQEEARRHEQAKAQAKAQGDDMQVGMHV